MVPWYLGLDTVVSAGAMEITGQKRSILTESAEASTASEVQLNGLEIEKLSCRRLGYLDGIVYTILASHWHSNQENVCDSVKGIS